VTRADDEALAIAIGLPIEQERLRATVERLAGVGSSPLGFRTTGTPEDRDVAEYAAGELRDYGLRDVAIEEVTVDGWRFEARRSRRSATTWWRRRWAASRPHRAAASRRRWSTRVRPSQGAWTASTSSAPSPSWIGSARRYLFVAHDLSVVRQVSDRIAVMYLGKLVEIGPAERVSTLPVHPYTEALLSAVPVPDPDVTARRERIVLHGDVPSPISPRRAAASTPAAATRPTSAARTSRRSCPTGATATSRHAITLVT